LFDLKEENKTASPGLSSLLFHSLKVSRVEPCLHSIILHDQLLFVLDPRFLHNNVFSMAMKDDFWLQVLEFC